MKTIQQILNLTKYINRQKDNEFIQKLWNEIKNEYSNIDIIELFSNEVFSEFISYDKKNYIIWDNSYWYLLLNHLIEIFNPMDINIPVVRDINYFLALKFFDNIEISSVHASEYKRLNAMFPYTIETKYLKDIFEIMNIIKTFCLFHELGHATKLVNPDIHAEYYDFTKKINQKLINLLKEKKIKSNFANFNLNEIDFKYINAPLLEELNADFFAFFKTIERYNLSKVLDAIFILYNFQNNIITVYINYKSIYNLLYKKEGKKILNKVNFAEDDTQFFIRYKLSFILMILHAHLLTGEEWKACMDYDNKHTIMSQIMNFLCEEAVITYNYERAKTIIVTDSIIEKRNSDLNWNPIN